MDAQQMIAVYEALLGLSGLMLEAARAADWDRLVALEERCRGHVARLRALGDALPALSDAERARKTDIIRRVLAEDAEVRRLAEPRLAELEHLIGNTRNQQRLLASYGAPA